MKKLGGQEAGGIWEEVGRDKDDQIILCEQFFNKTVTTEHEVTRRYVEVLGKIGGEEVGVDMI